MVVVVVDSNQAGKQVVSLFLAESQKAQHGIVSLAITEKKKALVPELDYFFPVTVVGNGEKSVL